MQLAEMGALVVRVARFLVTLIIAGVWILWPPPASTVGSGSTGSPGVAGFFYLLFWAVSILINLVVVVISALRGFEDPPWRRSPEPAS